MLSIDHEARVMIHRIANACTGLDADDAETVAYTGPRLDELLAASGVHPHAASPSDSRLIDVAVDTTIVIHGARPSNPPPVAARPYEVASRPAVLQPRTGQTEGSYSGPMAFSMSSATTPAAEMSSPSPRVGSKVAAAGILAAFGVLVGLLVGTSVSQDASKLTAVAAHGVTHERQRASERNALVSPALKKAPARPTKATRPHSHHSGPDVAPVAAPRVTEPVAPSDEDLQLLQAAKREHAL